MAAGKADFPDLAVHIFGVSLASRRGKKILKEDLVFLKGIMNEIDKFITALL